MNELEANVEPADHVSFDADEPVSQANSIVSGDIHGVLAAAKVQVPPHGTGSSQPVWGKGTLTEHGVHVTLVVLVSVTVLTVVLLLPELVVPVILLVQ
jgi:hypothetical protein